MTDFRTTQTFVGLFADWDPTIRVSKHYVEVLHDADPTIRVSKHYVEAVVDNDPLVRVTQYHLEVLYLDEQIDFIPETPRTEMFPTYHPVPYGERWGHYE